MQRYFSFSPHCPKNVFRILGCSHHADLTIGTLYRVSSVKAAHFLMVKSNNHIVVLEAHWLDSSYLWDLITYQPPTTCLISATQASFNGPDMLLPKEFALQLPPPGYLRG